MIISSQGTCYHFKSLKSWTSVVVIYVCFPIASGPESGNLLRVRSPTQDLVTQKLLGGGRGETAKHTLKSILRWTLWSWWHLGRFRHQAFCNPLYPILYIIYEIVLYMVSSTNLPHRFPSMVAQSYIPGTHTLGQEVDLVGVQGHPERRVKV